MSQDKSTEKSAYGIEIPISITKSMITASSDFYSTNIEGGNSLDYGLGVFKNFTDEISIKFGIHNYSIIFNPEITSHNIKVNESGKLNITSLYLRIVQESGIFFIGGGLDISVYQKYSADQSIYSGNYLLSKKNNVENSLFTEKFNSQYNINVLTGLIVALSSTKNLVVKPYANFSIPFKSLINSKKISNSFGNSLDENFLVKSYIVSFGLSLEFKN